MIPLFPQGLQGLSDSLWSGTQGSLSKIVGIDYRSKPGVFKAHQRLAKDLEGTVDELCKVSVPVSDGSTLWFSSESGKIWREIDGSWSLIYTTNYSDLMTNVLDISTNTSILFIFDGVATNSGKKSAQSFELTEDTDVKKIELRIRTTGTPTGTMTVSIQADSTDEPSGTPLVSSVVDMDVLTSDYEQIEFEFTTPFSLDAETKYWVVFEVSALPDFADAILVRGSADDVYSNGRWMREPVDTTDWTDYDGDQTLSIFRLLTPEERGTEETSGAKEFDGNIYWATDKVLNRVSVEQSETFGEVDLGFGLFENGSDFHPMVQQTRSLYIGDGKDIAVIDDLGLYSPTSAFELLPNETIQTLIDFDIDILVGTRRGNEGRVLRWDGVSDSWSAQDDIDEEGINAFIRDDNFVYVQAGSYGRMYFYNGEKLEPFKRIPGDWSPTSKAIVNANSVGFHLGVPVFGLSKQAGNPTLLGVYGFGSYGVGYPKTLSLDFPIGGFEDLEIGAILTIGADMYVAYKGASDVGVAKLDWSQKYNGAYFETPALIPPQQRSEFSIINGYNADYVELPENTDISLGVKKKYEANFTTLDKLNKTELQQMKFRTTTTNIANLIVRLDLTTSGNNSPLIENVSLE